MLQNGFKPITHGYLCFLTYLLHNKKLTLQNMILI